MATSTATSVMITGYLPIGVTDSKHKSAREANNVLRKVIKKADGKVMKFDVMAGTIFIVLKDEKGVEELRSALNGLDNVVFNTPSPEELVFKMVWKREDADSIVETAMPVTMDSKSVV